MQKNKRMHTNRKQFIRLFVTGGLLVLLSSFLLLNHRFIKM